MKRKRQADKSVEQNSVTRIIDTLVSTFLFIALLGLFGTVFTKLFGTSDVAWIVGFIVCVPLASITYAIIDRAFGALMILLLFAFPAVALILVLLLV